MEARTYYGSIVSGVMTQLDNAKKTPLMEITVSVTHVAGDGAWVPIGACERRLRLFCSENAWPYTERKLQLMGFAGDFAAPQFTCEGVELQCSHKPAQTGGKVYEEWDLANWGGEAQPASEEIVRAYTAKWRQGNGYSETPAASPPPVAAAVAPAPAPAQAQAPPPAPPAEPPMGPPTGDNIPF